ncbi:hypothetical protein PENTCL1PPCAC_9257 [Pristionchus entomophagus]|uniref:Uncharacterized protein n=1 Tax=Pristionchus entomophagus TaxID=358040 RepID=A0AAV5SWE8_9BILA|nr:hypothetical protein PENTCL1PPCAC_9257 [Pristionchus entomophagus]
MTMYRFCSSREPWAKRGARTRVARARRAERSQLSRAARQCAERRQPQAEVTSPTYSNPVQASLPVSRELRASLVPSLCNECPPTSDPQRRPRLRRAAARLRSSRVWARARQRRAHPLPPRRPRVPRTRDMPRRGRTMPSPSTRSWCALHLRTRSMRSPLPARRLTILRRHRRRRMRW